MINLYKNIYMDPLIFAVIIFSWVIGKTQELFILFAVISIHELFHIITARLCQFKLNSISITPIGIMAKINLMEYNSYSHEVLVCASGPIANLLMAILGYGAIFYLPINQDRVEFFILANICIFLINILPVLPLDGGRIFKVYFLEKLGYRITMKLFSILSKVVAVILIVVGIYQLIMSWYNISLIIIGLIIYLYYFKQREQMQYELLMEMIYKKNRLIKDKIFRVEYIVCFEDTKLIELIKHFHKNKYHIISVIDKNMQEIKKVTESQILDGLLKERFDVMIKEL